VVGEFVSSKLLYLRLILNISEQCQGLPVQQEKEVGQIHTPQRQTWFQQKHLETNKDAFTHTFSRPKWRKKGSHSRLTSSMKDFTSMSLCITS